MQANGQGPGAMQAQQSDSLSPLGGRRRLPGQMRFELSTERMGAHLVERGRGRVLWAEKIGTYIYFKKNSIL